MQALCCLKPAGGVLHVHENVTTQASETDKQAWTRFGEAMLTELKVVAEDWTEGLLPL